MFPGKCHKGHDKKKRSCPQHIEIFKDMPQTESDKTAYAEKDQPFKI